jgi:thiosulfate/3-mercaptopyruvate sulfurtransferase
VLCACFGTIVDTYDDIGLDADFADSSYVVSSLWLYERLADTSLVIIDARGAASHAAGHIPGALASEWSEYCDLSSTPADTGYARLLPQAQLAQVLGNKGISHQRRVVVYGDPLNGWGEEGHLVWLLRYLGVDSAAMLDGGYPYWASRGYATTTQPSSPSPVSFLPAVDSSLFASRAYVHARLGTLQIVDARAPQEYQGAMLYGEVRGGHIPGAVNVHMKLAYDTDGRFLRQSALEALFTGVGLSPADTVAAYCTGGVRSGLSTVVLRMAGYSLARNYQGSWWNWAADLSLPVEQ